MKIFVTAKPGAKKSDIKQIDAAHFAVSVKEQPLEGKANHAIAKVLAKHLGIPFSRIRLVSGGSSKQKTFEIR